ncbi:MAG: hypothetical protein CMJ70_15420 [Planctomycetaceae bacterium]|nr:hypothetical protein [Planctomycetaceae bacterium]
MPWSDWRHDGNTVVATHQVCQFTSEVDDGLSEAAAPNALPIRFSGIKTLTVCAEYCLASTSTPCPASNGSHHAMIDAAHGPRAAESRPHQAYVKLLGWVNDSPQKNSWLKPANNGANL